MIAPVVHEVDWVSLSESIIPVTIKLLVIFSSLLIMTFSLKVTGPSNCDKIWLETPPSTRILSLTITSSNTTDSLVGSSPVTVGMGISNVCCLPEEAEYLVLPMKKSPSLFIPV